MKKKIIIIVLSLVVLAVVGRVLKDQFMFGWSGIKYTFLTTEGKAKIPFTMDGSHVTFRASINKSDPLNIILDTGMPMSKEIMMWNSERIEKLNLNYTDNRELTGAGGDRVEIVTQVAKNVPVTLDEIEIHDLNIMVVPAMDAFTSHYDGIIGAAFFANFVVEINHDDMMIYLYDKSTYQPKLKNSDVPFQLHDGFPKCNVELTIGDKIVSTDLVVDIGANHIVSLNTESNEKLHLPEKTITTILGEGLSGSIYGNIGRVEKIQLGAFALENVISSFPSPDQQRNMSKVERNGNLGNGFFSRFNVTFDYSNEVLYLEPNHRHSEPIEFDMCGLHVTGHDNETLLVTRVLENSPANLANIVKDDVIVKINDQSISETTTFEFYRMCEKDGEILNLTISRNNELIEISVLLRRMI